MAQELFHIDDNTAVQCNPGGRFHGWLLRRHPDGQWVTVRKLEPVTDPFGSRPTPAGGSRHE